MQAAGWTWERRPFRGCTNTFRIQYKPFVKMKEDWCESTALAASKMHLKLGRERGETQAEAYATVIIGDLSTDRL
jgi:hypothetical protein